MAIIKATLAEKDYGLDIEDADGHRLRMDIPIEQGGNGSGFRPMQTLLAALCGCSSVDIISILKKQRQQLDGLEIEVDGDRELGKEPSLWKQIDLVFVLSGAIEPAKALRSARIGAFRRSPRRTSPMAQRSIPSRLTSSSRSRRRD
jgi:putative redox protein